VKLRLALALLLFPLAGIAQVTPGVDDAPATLSNKTASYGSNTFTGFGQLVPCTNGSTGTADTALLAAAATVGGNITLTGNCTVNAVTTLNSNTTLNLNGYTVTAAAASNWSGSTIAGFVQAANNASYITVENGYLVWTGASGSQHIIQFPSGNSHVKVLGVWSTGAGDLVATIGTTDALSQGNTCLNSLNACYDHWGGATDIKDIGNYASIITTVGASCYQFTGETTALGPAATSGYVALGNTCYTSVSAQIGINIDGYSTCTGGATDDQDIIADNRIYILAGTDGPGIRLSGCVNYADVHDNQLFADGATSSSWPAIEAGSNTTAITIHDNIAYGWLAPTTGSDDGVFNNQGAKGTIAFNECYGTCGSLLIGTDNAASTQIVGNDTGTGAYNVISATAGTPSLSVTNNAASSFVAGPSFLAPNLTSSEELQMPFGVAAATGNELQFNFNYGGSNNGNTYFGLNFYSYSTFFKETLLDALTLGTGSSTIDLGGTVIGGGGIAFTAATMTGCATTNGTPGTISGDSQGGKFVGNSSGAGCTVVITVNGATGATANHVWTCYGADTTSAVALVQSGVSTTTCTLKGTINATTDTIAFHMNAD
jgi:hypothetical protein